MLFDSKTTTGFYEHLSQFQTCISIFIIIVVIIIIIIFINFEQVKFQYQQQDKIAEGNFFDLYFGNSDPDLWIWRL